MKDSFKEISADARKSLVEAIASSAVANLISQTKSATEENSGTFKCIVSTADVDRQGDTVNQAGWDLSYFKSNPVVLWGHDYSSLPIGVCTSIEVKDGKLVAEGKFAPSDANPFAQNVRRLYELGMVRATSVGFIPKEFDAKKDGSILKQELLEFSFVPVPANPHALSLAHIKEFNLDVTMLKTKGIEINVKEEEKTTTTEKASVAESLDDMKQRKYMKWRAVCDLFEAIGSAYFDEATPSEDLGRLLIEAADIMKAMGGTAGIEPTDDEMKAVGERVKALCSGKKSIRAELDKDVETIKTLLEKVSTNKIALGLKAEGDKGSDLETTTTKQRSESSVKEQKEVNNFIETRVLLRSIDSSIEKILRKFNLEAKNFSTK